MQSGFSLVELSIVLVILGLLTGGILAGQSLIRAAELRAVSTEHGRYVTAIQTFRDKYFGIPGDLSNATAFWGKDNVSCTGDTGNTAIPGTCNGDNSGSVSWTGAVDDNEKFRFWQHLALAGLIEGSYTGIPSGAQHVVTIGVDGPASKLSSAGWGVGGAVNNVGTSTAWGANGSGVASGYGNFLTFGGQTANNPLGTVLTTEEAWNIDTKMDDGKPAQGKVFAYGTGGPNQCTTATVNTDFTGDYYLTRSGARCAFFFRNAF